MKRYSIFNTVLFAFLDCLFCWLSWTGSIFVFTYLFVTDYSLIRTANQNIPVMAAACVIFYAACGVYKSLWRHPGIGSMVRLGFAVFLSSFSVYLSFRLRLGYWPNPGLGMMAFYFLLTLSVGLRLYGSVFRTVTAYARRMAKTKPDAVREPLRTLLVGAGESAAGFILNKSQQGSRPREILAIVDNDARKRGYSLHGVRIMGGDEAIPELVRRFDIEEIVIAVPSMSNEDLRRIVRLTPVKRCKVRALSGLSADKASEKLRDISIGDLLGRPETDLDSQAIVEWVKGETVLVTGGGGSIGSELCRQLLDFGVGKLIIFDISENNAYNLNEELKVKFSKEGSRRAHVRIGSVQDEERLEEVFEEFKPSIVFHAAAYKHVPLMEDCPRLALENNVWGTYNAALCACRHSVRRFVMISTDKAVNPTNVMGATKRLAEMIVLGLNGEGTTEFVCVRFGNVLGSNGSVIPLFKRQIEFGGPVTITHPDMIRYFMTISEAVGLVLEVGAMAEGGEIFILDMGQPVEITELAESLIRMAGMTPGADIEIEYTGLRPGEKLYEELLLHEEGIKKTLNDKIFVVRPVLGPEAASLMSFMESGDFYRGDDARAFIKRFVPEYSYAEEEKVI